MGIYNQLQKNSVKRKKTIIFPESYDGRIIEAVKLILKRKLAKVILIQTGTNLESMIKPHRDLTIIDNEFRTDFLNEYHSIKTKKNQEYKISHSRNDLRDPLAFACMLLRNKFADGIVAGSVYSTSEVIKNAISIIGLSKNNKTVSSFFLFTFPRGHFHKEKLFVYADCGVIPDPTAEQLSDIAIQTSNNFHKLTALKPKVAFLSFSTKGSAKDESIDKLILACKLTKSRDSKLICDGELQFDAAFIPEVAIRKNPKGTIKGDANVFIFPDLNSGNIAYKITERVAGAIATGPIVQGLAKPVMDLSRGCSVNDIVNMTLVVSNLV